MVAKDIEAEAARFRNKRRRENCIEPSVIEGLSLVYITRTEQDVPPLKGLSVNGEICQLEDLYVFAAVLIPNLSNERYFPSPILSVGLPLKIYDNNKLIRYLPSLHYGPANLDNIVELSRDDNLFVGSDGKAFFNQFHEDIDAIVFEKPLKFDAAKQLVYVRSPNGSISFPELLHCKRFYEGPIENSEKEYSLVYANLEELKKANRWARNLGGSGGACDLNYEYNSHLYRGK